jgi:copper chaperone CopZ
VRKALETLPWVREVDVDFARQQAVVTVEIDKYDENALIEALGKYVLGGEVIKPPMLKAQPASVEKSTKDPGESKARPASAEKSTKDPVK